ncbi:MAG: S1/P1 nuclease [Alistipes sp.]|nr:S1/P1 nuclease [Alistipes sp.]
MKRFLISAAALFVTFNTMAWGTLGHNTIAELAERNLTPQAKANIEKYTKGEPLASYAMWMDKIGKDPILGRKGATRGWHASIVDADYKTSQEIRDKYRNGRDSATGLLELEKIFLDRKNHTDSVVMFALKCAIHMVGDMHCPAHLRYTDNKNGGGFTVYYFGRKVSLHSAWDYSIIQRRYSKKNWAAFAEHLDTYNKKQIKKCTAGWVEDWLEDAGRDVRPYLDWGISAGDSLDEEFDKKAYSLAEKEIRKSGYRLAKYLNTVFK